MSNPPELPPTSRHTSRYAVASLVVGILSFVAGYFGVLTGLVSTVLGIVAITHISANSRLAGRKLAVAGVILGGLAVVFALTIYDWNALFHDTPKRERHFGGPAHFP
ncbi:MAG: DUF4190 domain-containing protein [Chthoniobacter sp.]|nr:DUF4190 domain-containing protein [Chthoniobacter sp.]